MLKRIPHGFYATVFGTAFLAMGVNVLLIVACVPFLTLLMTTDPSLSWPLLAVTGAACAPGLAASFSVFRQHKAGENRVVKPFIDALRATWKPALAVGFLVAAAVVVAVVDVMMLAPTEFGMLVAPVLAVVAVVALATGAVSLVAISETPDARLRDVVRVAAVVSVRRWYLSVASLAVIGFQAAIVVAAPALGIGITSAACLYIVWAGSRFALQQVTAPASQGAAA
ncbi:ferredoxin-NADPH reductase [Paramicrobacterium fandaimingii]|uniref:ferredoxin-NADPH reductase n=1 Tax=Paramicrobacterium fandaimingii TaxID=2708079 RepID=UPI001420D526|nr:ferredoxin-NADPH reductase [Microbacterium fandaimingii]